MVGGRLPPLLLPPFLLQDQFWAKGFADGEAVLAKEAEITPLLPIVSSSWQAIYRMGSVSNRLPINE